MAKTKKEKQFELNQLMEMRAPQQDWLTREIYQNWLENKLEIKARHTARLIIQDLFPQDSHQLNPEPVWGSYEVDESPKTLVDKWKDGELISNPETGQDPKSYSKPNKECAEIHAGRHWGYEDKLNQDGTLQTGPMWINRGAFNIVVIDGRTIMEPVDVEHRVWGLIGFPLGLLKLKSEDNKPMFFESHKLPKKMIPHFGEKVQAIQVNDMDLYEIVDAANQVIQDELDDTAQLVTVDDVLKRYYSHKFKYTLLPFYEKHECERYFREVNSHSAKSKAQMLHASSSDSNWFLKTISSPKVTEFKGNEFMMHPFFKLFPNSSQVKLEPFMLSHLISQHLVEGDLVESSDAYLSKNHGTLDGNLDKEQVVETLDYFYGLYNKLDEFKKPGPQMIQMILKTRSYLDGEGFTLIDKKLFIDEFLEFVAEETFEDNGEVCTKFGYDMRGSVPGADVNKKGLKRAFDHIKTKFLGNRLSDEGRLREIGIVKKSDDLPRLFKRPVINESLKKHKGQDIDDTPVDGMPVGGHTIADMELIRLTPEQRQLAYEEEGYKGKFNFNETCRAMSSYHNLRMGALRLSEYKKIMNKPDVEVKLIVKRRYEELRVKPILV